MDDCSYLLNANTNFPSVSKSILWVLRVKGALKMSSYSSILGEYAAENENTASRGPTIVNNVATNRREYVFSRT